MDGNFFPDPVPPWFKETLVPPCTGYSPSSTEYSALQISLDLCIPEKELAKTRSQISFIYFQSHLWYSARNY